MSSPEFSQDASDFLAQVAADFDASLGDAYSDYESVEDRALPVGPEFDAETFDGLLAAAILCDDAGDFATEEEREKVFGFLEYISLLPDPDAVVARLESFQFLDGMVVTLRLPTIHDRFRNTAQFDSHSVELEVFRSICKEIALPKVAEFLPIQIACDRKPQTIDELRAMIMDEFDDDLSTMKKDEKEWLDRFLGYLNAQPVAIQNSIIAGMPFYNDTAGPRLHIQLSPPDDDGGASKRIN